MEKGASRGAERSEGQRLAAGGGSWVGENRILPRPFNKMAN